MYDFNSKVNAVVLDKETKEVKDCVKALKNYNAAVLDKVNEGREVSEKFKSIDEIHISGNESDTKILGEMEDSDEFKAFQKAKKALMKAKEKVLRASEDKETVEFLKNYDEAVEALKNKKSARVAELVKDEKLTSAYESVKKLFPKTEGKSRAAGLWGGCAAAGLILGLSLKGSNKKEA